MQHPSKLNVVLNVFTKNMLFCFSKGHKWLKEALQKQQKLINFGIEIPELHWFLIYKDNFSTYLGTNNKNITHLKCNI